MIKSGQEHATGDEVLRQFAARMSSVLRPTDAVARLGGDEFIIALTGIRHPDDAALVADKLVALACQPFAAGQANIEVGASVGVAIDTEGNLGWRELVAQADARAYEAKAAGRGRRAGGATAEPPCFGFP